MEATFTRIVQRAPFHDEGYGYDVFGLHPPAVASFVDRWRAIYDSYFRVDSSGAQHIPSRGAAIVVANHGGVLPVDSAMLCLDILRQTEPPRIPRPVSDHFVPRLPLVSTVFARMGVVSGTRANVKRLLERDELIAIWPEGVSGPAKPFRERYRIQAWRVGFAELAIRYRAPVVPVAVVGAEESWPVLARLRALRMFGSPYLPIPATPFPLPAHYHIRYGEPMLLDACHDDPDDPACVAAAADEVKLALEHLLADARVERRGVFR
jgi:1-acyl-sn-glycerol-3-phosphate acyltransferase